MIIAFSHPKGGVGKTLLAFNYAMHCLLNKEKIIVADLDGQHSITNFNNIRSALSISPNLDIKSFDNVESLISFLQNIDNDTKVVIDTGGFDSAYNRIAIALADLIITPVSDSPVEIMRLLDFDRILDDISKNANHELLTYIIINRIHPSLRNLEYIKEPFKEKKHFKFLESAVKDRARIKFSVAEGRSVYEEIDSIRDEKAIKELNNLFNEINNVIISKNKGVNNVK